MNATIKNASGIALIIALIVSSASIHSYVRSYARVSEPASFRSFSVGANGKAIAVPDIAKITAGVITEGGTDIGALQDDNTKKVNGIIELLETRKIDGKDIATQNYSIEPRYQYTNCADGGVCPPPKIVGYVVRQDIMIKIRDFKEIGPILSGVVEKGANSVSQLQFTIDDETSLEAKARGEAIDKAKEKALEIAKAGGFTVGRLLSISESGEVPPVYGYGMGGAKESAFLDRAPIVEPGSQEVIVNVILTYEIK